MWFYVADILKTFTSGVEVDGEATQATTGWLEVGVARRVCMWQRRVLSRVESGTDHLVDGQSQVEVVAPTEKKALLHSKKNGDGESGIPSALCRGVLGGAKTALHRQFPKSGVRRAESWGESDWGGAYHAQATSTPTPRCRRSWPASRHASKRQQQQQQRG